MGTVRNMTRTIPDYTCNRFTPACRVYGYDHTSIRMRIPEGLGPNVELRVGVISPTSTTPLVTEVPVVYNYATPSITNVAPNPLNSAGGEVTLYGDNFGLTTQNTYSPPPVVRINGEGCVRSACGVCCVLVSFFSLPRVGVAVVGPAF